MLLPNFDSPEFPVFLKKIRKTLGLSCRKLAEEADITVTLISKYERPVGRYFVTPKQETWDKLNNAVIRLMEEYVQKSPWITGAEYPKGDNPGNTRWIKTNIVQQ